VIVKAGVNVHGLTTAACLWIVSAIGGLTFVITFLTLWLLERLERRLPSRLYRFLTVTIESGGENEKALLEAVRGHRASVKRKDYTFSRDKKENSYGFTVTLRDEELLTPLMREVGSLPFVKSFTLRT
jgi:putative Mg2+ transporter-C (MgtC) family protein